MLHALVVLGSSLMGVGSSTPSISADISIHGTSNRIGKKKEILFRCKPNRFEAITHDTLICHMTARDLGGDFMFCVCFCLCMDGVLLGSSDYPQGIEDQHCGEVAIELKSF